MDKETIENDLEVWLEQHKIKLNTLNEKYSESGKQFYEQAANLKEIAHKKMQNIHSDEFDSITALQNLVEFLTEENKYLKSKAAYLHDAIEICSAIFESEKLTDVLTDITDNINEQLIDAQEKIIHKYQLGTKKKSEISQQKWALAQLYFAEEIPKHKTLLSARKAATKRAGINVNERRLIQMLPVEK